MTDIFVAPRHKEKMQKPSTTRSKFPIFGDSDKVGFLSTFCKNPKEISFQTQKPDESIILFLRSHPITNLPWIFTTGFLTIVPIIIALTFPMLNINIFASPNIAHFITVYVLLYYLIVFSYTFVSALHWFYSVFIVTTQQVVDIDYSDIVIHHVAVTSLNQIQDAKYTQSGFIPTFFKYGNIFVQTAGTQSNFQESSIPNPREATQIIGDIIGKGQTRARRFPEENLK